MLQSCVQRLSHQWPEADIMVIAHEVADLASYCPEAMAIERTSARHFLRFLPHRYEPVWQSMLPYLSGRRINRRQTFEAQPRTAVQAVRAADVVVAAGGGYLTDTFPWHATGVLGILSLAQRLGKPTAMFGQGIGPIRQQALRMQARAVLPKLAVLGLRESRMGRDLARSFGAQPDAMVLTGDDALELLEYGTAQDGHALGVNMRVANYSGVDSQAAAVVGTVVVRAAEVLRVPVVALPVSRHSANADLRAIRSMLPQEHPQAELGLRDLVTPQDLITATASCRAIVTGSYHAAVFSIAQGIPAVCVTKSSYYDAKFAGLSALFPSCCFVVSFDPPEFPGRLRVAIQQAWDVPAPLRAAARHAAQGLREAGRAAYAQFRNAVDGKAVTYSASGEGLIK
jgi:polysaccharide pyruvyl transferase WcaK-like protein